MSDNIVGRTLVAPARIWPSLAPPPGKSGWEGTVTGIKSKDPELYWVMFPGDRSRYFFEGKDVRSWLVKDKKKQPKSAGEGEEDKPESSKQAGKKRSTEERGSPVKASPVKKEKASGGAGPAPAGLAKPLPPKPAGPSPLKPTKPQLLDELNPLIQKMSTSQVAQLLEEARKIAK